MLALLPNNKLSKVLILLARLVLDARRDTPDPRDTKPKTDTDAESLANEPRTEILDAIVTLPMTENLLQDPNAANPKTLHDEPSRPDDRSDSPDPQFVKFHTDNRPPHLEWEPRMDTLLPSKAAPMVDTALLVVIKEPRIDTDDPKLQ
jgi:hypothetical protein